jgi:cell wall assembly regulator SMI1
MASSPQIPRSTLRIQNLPLPPHTHTLHSQAERNTNLFQQGVPILIPFLSSFYNSKSLSRKPSRSQPSPLLPLHNTPLSPPPQYPPLEKTWTRIRNWLSTEYPELGDTLNYGILPQDLASIEMQFGFSLPQVIRESYLIVDGQEPESSAGCSEGLFFGLHHLPLEEVLEEWRFWREVDDDPNTGAHVQLREYMQSVPPGWIRKEYSQRGWIPLISDKTGNYVGVDLNPGEGGSVGQVIVFGRDFDTKVVFWRGDGPAGWATWLASFAEVLESGEGFELGASNESEGSEDDVGYEGYFFDGTGRGGGEGTGGMSSGGMRLAGEYRGWTTLEAWADKSVRKWQQVGLVPDPPVGEKGKVCPGLSLPSWFVYPQSLLFTGTGESRTGRRGSCQLRYNLWR